MVELTRQFALFKQTILNDTRSIGLQVLRFAFIVVLAFIFITTAAQVQRWGTELDGRYFFEFIFVINLFYVLTASLFLFLPLIREEKEENTLGMILMTGISPFAYLFGKVGSRFLMLLFIMAIQIPITYLCVTLGGISLYTIFYSYLLLVITAFFLSNLFLLSSLIGSSIFSCIFISFGIIIISSYLMNFTIGEYYQIYDSLSPFRLFEMALNDVFSSTANIRDVTVVYLISLGVLGSIFFALSVYFFNALTGDQKEIDLPKKLKSEKASKQNAEMYSGKGVKRLVRKLKTKRFAESPIIYKDFRFSTYGPLLYILQFLVIIGCCFVFILDNSLYTYRGFDIYEVVKDLADNDTVLFFIFCLIVVTMLSSHLVFSQEIKNNTLTTLKVLPYKPSKLFRDKTICVLRVSAPTFIVFLIIFALYCYFNSFNNHYYSYNRISRRMQEFYLFFTLLIPGYFLNAWLSMAFKRYSFFLANGITFGVFAIQFMFFDIFRIRMSEGLWILTFTGIVISVIAYMMSLRKLDPYSATS